MTLKDAQLEIYRNSNISCASLSSSSRQHQWNNYTTTALHLLNYYFIVVVKFLVYLDFENEHQIIIQPEEETSCPLSIRFRRHR